MTIGEIGESKENVHFFSRLVKNGTLVLTRTVKLLGHIPLLKLHRAAINYKQSDL